MRFEVPQFIEIEDKIFGPFTWRQFLYLAGGAGFPAVLFFVAPFIIFAIIGLPIAGLAFLLAFYPVNNRPFSDFLGSIVQYFGTNRLYLWRKKTASVYSNQPTASESVGNSYTPPTSGKNLNSLARKLELKAIQKDI